MPCDFGNNPFTHKYSNTYFFRLLNIMSAMWMWNKFGRQRLPEQEKVFKSAGLIRYVCACVWVCTCLCVCVCVCTCLCVCVCVCVCLNVYPLDWEISAIASCGCLFYFSKKKNSPKKKLFLRLLRVAVLG